jgi:hypothetical protein
MGRLARVGAAIAGLVAAAALIRRDISLLTASPDAARCVLDAHGRQRRPPPIDSREIAPPRGPFA